MIPRSGASIVVREPKTVELSDAPLPPDAVVGGSPAPADGEIAIWSTQAGVATGVWRCTPGVFTDVEVDETFIVLSGMATIEPEGGKAVEVKAGDVCVLPAGLHTTWTIHETLLKVYVLADESD